MFLPGSERGNVQNITTMYVVAIGEMRSEALPVSDRSCS